MVSKVTTKMKPKYQIQSPSSERNSPSKAGSPYLNCSVAMATTQPTNASELQLYRVLQRANLLQYYETFITQGGDDVQQLCEAGEEEFLEIMALVGMASKPLHVRRLQKSLQEWVANPGADISMFQQPPMAALTPPPGPPGSIVASVAYAVHQAANNSVISTTTWNPRPAPAAATSPATISAVAAAAAAMTAPMGTRTSSAPGTRSPSPPPTTTSSSATIEFVPSPAHSTGGLDTPKNSPSPSNGIKRDSSSPSPMPVLSDSQIKAIAQAAERLAKSLPPLDPKPLNSKKQICKEIDDLLLMPPGHPERMDLLRKYAAIYGRFDSKRKNEKPMSLHEISVNEAAAQLCAHTTALLTRREELFPLARTVVRDSGYQYAKGHSRAQNEALQEPPTKRCKISILGKKSFKSELDKIHQEERLAEIHTTLTQISAKQEELKSRLAEDPGEEEAKALLQGELEALTTQHLQLVAEQGEIVQRLANNIRYHVVKKASQGGLSADDETDSSNLASGGSSPRNGTGDPDDLDYYKSKVKSEAKGQLQQTLFDEGLRIAQQYGMADFAEELKGLKQGSDDSRDATENGNNNDPEDKTERDSWSCDGDREASIRGQSPKSNFNLGRQNESNSHVAIETS